MIGLALLVAAAGLVACGGDGGSAGSTEEAPSRLTPAQFSALEDSMVAALPLDELDSRTNPPSPARVQALARPMVAKCDVLDEDHALLGAVREACLTSARWLIASYAPAGCRTAEACARGFADARAAGRAMVDAGRASDRAVADAAIPAACKAALSTPEAAYAYFRKLDARVKRFVEALRAESAARIRSTTAALRRLGDADVRTGRESLAQFRAGCR